MATAAPLDEPRETECTVCHEQFTLPKILPCGHLLCRHCLISWLKTQAEANCPMCRYPIVDGVLAPGETFEDVADSFPSHLFMEAVVKAECLLSGPQECCVCEDVAAVSMCFNCGDMFCQACTTVHKKQSLSRHHQVEDLSTLTAVMLAAKRPATCPFHTNELSHAYCHTHNIAICVLCATIDHHECQRVVKLESKAGESLAVLREVATTLKTGEKKLERAIQEVNEDLKNLGSQTDAAVAKIEDARQRLERAFQACFHRLKEKILSTSSDIETKMLDGKTMLLKQQGRFAMHSQMVQHMEEFSLHGSFNDMTSTMKRRIDSLDCSDKFLTSARLNSKVTLTLDPQELIGIEQQLSQMEFLPVLRFHDNHGKKIKLSNNGQTAERTDMTVYDGVLISQEPMIVNRLYEVRIDDINTKYIYTFIGVVACNSDAFQVPNCSFDQTLTNVLCVNENGGSAFGHKLDQKWPGLFKVPAGTEVGLVLNSSRSLHLYINGEHQGVIFSRIPDPCCFLFDMFSHCTKVTGLPIRPLQAVGSQAE